MSTQASFTPATTAATVPAQVVPVDSASPRTNIDTSGGFSFGQAGVSIGSSYDGTARLRHLVGLCLWALVLGLGGAVVGVVALVKIIIGAPGWFEPLIALVGLVGLGLTIAAFPMVQRRWTPWALLGGATVVLIGGIALTTAI